MGLVSGEKLPFEYWRWTMAKELGWTLDTIDALSMREFHEFLQVRDGTAKGIKAISSKRE